MSAIPFPGGEKIESDVVIYTCAKCGAEINYDECPNNNCPFDYEHKPERRIRSTYHRTDVLISREVV